MTTRVVGIGQPVAGDDGVGHAVLDALAMRDLPARVELTRLRDASGLLDLFAVEDDVIVVDALVSEGAAGEVLVLDREAIHAGAMSGVSSHGLGVRQTLELARTLHGKEPKLRFVAIRIAPPAAYREGLSPEVAQAVPRAVDALLTMMKGDA